MDILKEARHVFDIEIEALEKTKSVLDETFSGILDQVINCNGKIVITGMGKPGHIGKKIAATLSSLGTPAFYLHPAEALHGDLGMVSANDIVIIISYSGESEEIIRIIPNLKMIGSKIIGITGNNNSTLAQCCDLVQLLPKFEEACSMGLAPTSSTTVALVYGDALAVTASCLYGFTKRDFGMYHPAGALGKKLILKVSDLMAKCDENAVLYSDATIKEVIIELSKKGLGIVTLVDGEKNHIDGVVTDGDLRRALLKGVDVYSIYAKDIMSCFPLTISESTMAITALQILKEKNVSAAPVVDISKHVVGTITMQSILKAGIVT